MEGRVSTTAWSKISTSYAKRNFWEYEDNEIQSAFVHSKKYLLEYKSAPVLGTHKWNKTKSQVRKAPFLI